MNLFQNLTTALAFDDVLLIPQHSEITSRALVDLSTQLSPNIKLTLPFISANMDTITGVKMAIAMGKLGGLGILPRFETPEITADKVAQIKKENVYAAISIGVKPDEMKRAELSVAAGVDIINIDVAHGHMQKAIETTAWLKNTFGNKITIISGIVATGDAAQAHYEAGADIVACGVGGGSICTTRIQTGCGIPTLQSIIEIAPIARKYKKAVIPLAGIRNSGDIVKSLAAGASAIWGGNIFSGTDENPGEITEIDGKMFKSYNGSTSKKEKISQIELYSTDKSKNYTRHVEGVSGKVLYRGSINNVVEDLSAGVRSGFTYCGAKTIEELWEKAQFVRVSPNVVNESKPHDILLA